MDARWHSWLLRGFLFAVAVVTLVLSDIHWALRGSLVLLVGAFLFWRGKPVESAHEPPGIDSEHRPSSESFRSALAARNSYVASLMGLTALVLYSENSELSCLPLSWLRWLLVASVGVYVLSVLWYRRQR